MRQRFWIVGIVCVLGCGVLGCGEPPPGEGDGSVGGDSSTPMDGSSAVECTSDVDCDDELYCNGAERCAPGTGGADARGCAGGSSPCGAGEICQEARDACEADCPDADGDGVTSAECGGTDCDDADERRYPGATEACDRAGLDEDCDPTTLGDDADSDGYVSDDCCNELPTGRVECGLDCDDTLAGVSPSQTDVCGAGDQDCDGAVDENPDTTFYRDLDGDGHGVVDMTTQACSAPPGYAVLAGDCDDALGSVNPGVGELCNLRDDDCNEGIDEGCECSPEGRSEACGATDVGTCRRGSRTCVAGAWSECSGLVEPATEICDGAEDEDCDGTVDDGCECVNGETRLCGMSIGVCRSVSQTCTSGRWPRACADEPGVVSPGVEQCDGLLDQDCDGAVDEDCACTNGSVDRSACGTDTGECVSGMRTCSAGAWGACSGGVGPATESCDGSRDEDCDSAVDEGCTCTNGTTRPCGIGECVGEQTCGGGAWGACSGSAPATEICNGLDDDCDGRTDASDSDTAMVGSSCGTDTGLCTVGSYSCPGASLVCSGVAPVAEVCDHQDHDCDGTIDESAGVATCSRTFSTGAADEFDNHFVCRAAACSGIGDSVALSRTADTTATARTAELVPYGTSTRQTVDWGMDMGIIAYFDMAWDTSTVYPAGEFGVLVSPSFTPGTTTVSNNRFPVLTGSERGYAVTYNILIRAVELWELTSAGPQRRALGDLLPSGCALVDGTTREARIELHAVSGTLTAVARLPWCGGVSMATYADADFNQVIYGETSSYPRYAIGTYGWGEDTTNIVMDYFYVRRAVTASRPHCLTCPW